MSTHQAEYTWERDDSYCLMHLLYDWSRPVPATWLDPPQGGLELSSICCADIEWPGDEMRRPTVEEMSEVELSFPNDLAFKACLNDHLDREQDAQMAEAEMRSGR